MKTNNRTVLDRIIKLIIRNARIITSPYFYKNFIKWQKLKGKYKGERVFLIGNGPSLNKTPLYLLKDEYTFCFNRFNLMLERLNWLPSFYMVMDSVVALDMKDEINEMIKQVDISFFPDISTDFVNFREFVEDIEDVFYFHPEPLEFSNHLPWLKNGDTVVFPAFQILKYLGFSEIYFCGVDVNYVFDKTSKIVEQYRLKGKTIGVIESNEDDDPNHFDPRYFGKGRVYHQPDSDVVATIFRNMNTVYNCTKNSSVKVINVGYDSNVGNFEKTDFIEALNYSEDKVKQMFESLIVSFNFKTLEQFFKSANYCNNLNDWKSNIVINALATDKAVGVIKSKIFEAIPIGPYEGYIYFINRNASN